MWPQGSGQIHTSVQAGGIASASIRPQASARVDAVLYAEEHAPGGKPSRAAFAAALAAVGVPASQVVFIGDNLVKDIQGAHAAGLSTIRVAGAADLRLDDGAFAAPHLRRELDVQRLSDRALADLRVNDFAAAQPQRPMQLALFPPTGRKHEKPIAAHRVR